LPMGGSPRWRAGVRLSYVARSAQSWWPSPSRPEKHSARRSCRYSGISR
jgi:hypothetical protein